MNLLEEYEKLLGHSRGIFYSMLAEKYNEPHRKYHNLDHIEDGLNILKLHESNLTIENQTILKVAWFFHDSEYVIGADDNEEKSAQFADARIPWFHQEPKDVVMNYIRATKDHIPIDNDSAILMDIDMSILGRDREEFIAYENKIREEFLTIYTPEEYKLGRTQFLEKESEKYSYFHLPYFQDIYQAKAEENISWLLSELQK